MKRATTVRDSRTLGEMGRNSSPASVRRLTLGRWVLDITDKKALYNFPSTVNGPHLVTSRAWRAQWGFGS